jgi:hypothetical protein
LGGCVLVCVVCLSECAVFRVRDAACS